jgi:hypothetical protein
MSVDCYDSVSIFVRPPLQYLNKRCAGQKRLEEIRLRPRDQVWNIDIKIFTLILEHIKALPFKVHLHYGDSHAKLLRLKEQKIFFGILKNPRSEKFLQV